MRMQHLTPLDVLIPGGRGEGFVTWHFEHVSIAQASATDPGSMQYHHAFENADLQYPVGAEGRQPQILPELPVGFGEVFVVVAFSFFKDEDGIALFGQPHGGDTAPETRADN